MSRNDDYTTGNYNTAILKSDLLVTTMFTF